MIDFNAQLDAEVLKERPNIWLGYEAIVCRSELTRVRLAKNWMPVPHF